MTNLVRKGKKNNVVRWLFLVVEEVILTFLKLHMVLYMRNCEAKVSSYNSFFWPCTFVFYYNPIEPNEWNLAVRLSWISNHDIFVSRREIFPKNCKQAP